MAPVPGTGLKRVLLVSQGVAFDDHEARVVRLGKGGCGGDISIVEDLKADGHRDRKNQFESKA